MENKVVPLKSHQVLRGLMDRYYQEAKEARGKGQPIAWCSGVAPTDLLSAMGFFVLFPENHAALCGSRKVSVDLCEESENHGYLRDLCSYARNDLGSIFAGEETASPIGGIPRPDLLVISNNQCGTVAKWFEATSRLFGVPLIVIDVPFLHDGQGDDYEARALAYVKEQLQEMASFLVGFTGRPFNYDRLQECVAITGTAARLWQETLALAKHRPSPLTCFDIFIHIFPIMCLRGDPQGVEYYRLFNQEVRERMAQGVAAVPGEKFRLYWDNIPIWYRLRELSQKFASYSACLVTAAYPYNWSLQGLDASRPLESVAKALTLPFINRGVGYRIDFIAGLVKDYQVDGLVMQASRTCKPFFLGQPDIVEEVERRTGVPGVFIEGDMVDSRLYSDAQVENRIEAFMEVLEGRRLARG